MIVEPAAALMLEALEKIGRYAFEQGDHLLVVSKDERRVGKKLKVRNVAVRIARASEEGARWLKELE